MNPLNYSSDSKLYARIMTLLESSFPGIEHMAETSITLGTRWADSSRPFCIFDAAEQPIAHLGLIELPITVQNKPYNIATLHAICTHPDYRKRGHFKTLMNEALNFIDNHYQGAQLFTKQPSLYEPFGFRKIQEFKFSFNLNSASFKPEKRYYFRNLNLQDAYDRNLIQSLLSIRAPVSAEYGIREEQNVFLFNMLQNQAYYNEDLDLCVVYKIENEILHLYDIVSSNYRSINDILPGINQSFQQVITYFSPDKWSFGRPHEVSPLVAECHLMARGKWLPRDFTIAVPMTAHC